MASIIGDLGGVETSQILYIHDVTIDGADVFPPRGLSVQEFRWNFANYVSTHPLKSLESLALYGIPLH